jgi:hypothetical protein
MKGARRRKKEGGTRVEEWYAEKGRDGKETFTDALQAVHVRTKCQGKQLSKWESVAGYLQHGFFIATDSAIAEQNGNGIAEQNGERFFLVWTLPWSNYYYSVICAEVHRRHQFSSRQFNKQLCKQVQNVTILGCLRKNYQRYCCESSIVWAASVYKSPMLLSFECSAQNALTSEGLSMDLVLSAERSVFCASRPEVDTRELSSVVTDVSSSLICDVFKGNKIPTFLPRGVVGALLCGDRFGVQVADPVPLPFPFADNCACSHWYATSLPDVRHSSWKKNASEAFEPAVTI